MEIVEIKFSPIQLQLAVGYVDGKIKIYEGDIKGNWTVLVRSSHTIALALIVSNTSKLWMVQ